MAIRKSLALQVGAASIAILAFAISMAWVYRSSRLQPPVDVAPEHEPGEVAKRTVDWDALVAKVIQPDEPVEGFRGGSRIPTLPELARGEVPEAAAARRLEDAWAPVVEALQQLDHVEKTARQRDLALHRPLLHEPWPGPALALRADAAGFSAWRALVEVRQPELFRSFRSLFLLGQLADRRLPASPELAGLAGMRLGIRIKRTALAHLHRELARGDVMPVIALRLAYLLQEVEVQETPLSLALPEETRQDLGTISVEEWKPTRDLDPVPLERLRTLEAPGFESMLEVWVRWRTLLRGVAALAYLQGSRPHGGRLSDLRDDLDRLVKGHGGYGGLDPGLFQDPVSGQPFRIEWRGDELRMWGVGLDGRDDGGDDDSSTDVVVLPYGLR